MATTLPGSVKHMICLSQLIGRLSPPGPARIQLIAVTGRFSQREANLVAGLADHLNQSFIKKLDDCGLDAKLGVEREELVSQVSDSWWVPCWDSEQVEDLPLYCRALTLRLGSLLDRLPRWLQQGDRTPSHPSRGLLGFDFVRTS